MMYPKGQRQENRALLDLARGRPCLMTAVYNCETTRGDSTVAAHSNWSDLGGKGGHRKADDSYSVWVCGPCHAWLDQSSAPKAEKRRAWLAAYERQVEEWQVIAASSTESAKARLAAQWALDCKK